MQPLTEESHCCMMEVVVGGDRAKSQWAEGSIVLLDQDTVRGLQGGERRGDYISEEGVNGGRVRLL